MPRAEPSPAPRHGYGRMARLLHWAIALLIAAAIYLGLTMTDLPATDEAEIAEVFRTYSLHKTIGVAVLALALIRILWTLARPGPGPLHPERRIETFLARFTHWDALDRDAGAARHRPPSTTPRRRVSRRSSGPWARSCPSFPPTNASH